MLPAFLCDPVQDGPLTGRLFRKQAAVDEIVHLVPRAFGGHAEPFPDFLRDKGRIGRNHKLVENLRLAYLGVWATRHACTIDLGEYQSGYSFPLV